MNLPAILTDSTEQTVEVFIERMFAGDKDLLAQAIAKVFHHEREEGLKCAMENNCIGISVIDATNSHIEALEIINSLLHKINPDFKKELGLFKTMENHCTVYKRISH